MISITMKVQQNGNLVQEPNATSQAAMRHKPLKTKSRNVLPRQINEPIWFSLDSSIRIDGPHLSSKIFCYRLKDRNMTTRNYDTNNLEDMVYIWLRSQRTHGAKVLIYLMDHPNTPLHVSYLDWCTANDEWPEPDNIAISGFEAQPQIPMADQKTRHECCQAAKLLMNQIQGAIELGDEKLERKLKLEYDFVMKYLRQITTPKKQIKKFPAYWDKAYHNVYTCVYKVVSKLANSHPGEARYVAEHLQKGQWFMWKADHTPRSQTRVSFEMARTDFELAE